MPAKITCDACGKTYAWKPQFAGRTLKCVCGSAIKAPLTAPDEAPPRRDLSSADEFDRAFAGGYQQDEAPPPRRVATGLAGAIAAAGAPKARKYEVDYSGGDVYTTVRKLRLAMSLVALVVSVGAYFVIHAALARKAQVSRQLVTYQGGQRKVYQVNADGTRVQDVTDTADPNAPLTSLAPATPPPGAKGSNRRLTPEQKALQAGVAAEDKRIADMIKNENLSEAREWCAPAQDGRHTGRVLQLEIIRGWANTFYEAGAKTVWMKATKRGDVETARQWVVELPNEPSKRQQVLQKVSQLHHEMPIIDMGNKYLMFSVDR